MSVYEHDRARVYGCRTQFVTVLPVAAFCTCGGVTGLGECDHITEVHEHLAAARVTELHRLERDRVRYAISVLPDVPRATA